MNNTTRAQDVPLGRKPSMEDIQYLLKEGNIAKYMSIKNERLMRYEMDRFRLCARCTEKLNRNQFDGLSKYCIECSKQKIIQAKHDRKEYQKNYKINSDTGKQLHCAKQVVYYMKKAGILTMQPCEKCSEEITQAHHDDYNRPWEVRWMCVKCHNKWHKDNNPVYIDYDNETNSNDGTNTAES